MSRLDQKEHLVFASSLLHRRRGASPPTLSSALCLNALAVAPSRRRPPSALGSTFRAIIETSRDTLARLRTYTPQNALRARARPDPQVRDVELRYTARQAGPIDEVYACRVFGMALPLGFAISGKNRGPTLSFGLVGDGQRPPRPLQRPQLPQYVGGEPLPEPEPAPPLEVHAETKNKLFL